ncbi:hypothetical protein [Longimicrobium sp.]|jgi:uncharacterized membrane protein|uniref:hypothetical protein n=1 Tax=Longimicrobium sp. TaxID=2029185 RepID=UPI002F941221
MRTTLILHITAGSLALISGYIALFAAKGARVHRGSGAVFVYAMLAMSILGIAVAAGRGVAPAINIPAGLLCSYLVVTALTAVRPVDAATRWLNAGAMLVAIGVSLTSLTFGIQAAAHGGTRNGMPAFPFFMFGIVALLGSAGDLRMIRSGVPPRGSARIARHLWRMCFALFIAALSFFIGQADEFPKALRIPLLLAIPVLAPVVSMAYWVWRIRSRPPVRRAVIARAAAGAGLA